MAFRMVARAVCIAAWCLSSSAGANELTRPEAEQLAAQCVTCHQVFVGTRARRASGVPDIRGQAPETTLKNLRDFKSGAREHLIMADIAGDLDDAEMRALAEYYATVAHE